MRRITARIDLAARVSSLATAWFLVLLYGVPARGQCLAERLFAADAAAGDYFGGAIAMSDDTIIIGAQEDDTLGGADAGSAYVFVRSGGVWVQQAQLLASDGGAGDRFGAAVALSGNTAVVGAYQDDRPAGPNVGSAYVFVRSGGVWTQQAQLVASDGGGGEWFGWSIALDGDSAIVGAMNARTGGRSQSGAAYVFIRSDGAWTQQARLSASDSNASDRFGSSVGIAGDTVVVGAFGDDTAAGSSSGSAYVLARDGGAWSEQAHLFASDGTPNDAFGYETAISGDTVIVGAPGLVGTGGGSRSAYVFVHGGGDWTEQARLLNPDGHDYFGSGVAISGDAAIVGDMLADPRYGADAGAVSFFVRSGVTWSRLSTFYTHDRQRNDWVGWGAAISNNTVVVGATGDDTANGNDAGSAHVFHLSSTPLVGDVNGSGATDLSDLAILLAHFGRFSGMIVADGDLDDDGDVDMNDLSLLLADFGRTCP